ncbi:hypothetical protein CHS0354_004743 [Potamilus streckersoni]|uniref:Cysteine and tyrosine-rich protein 1 n=1 Tax=Potamilus streckersoni TaxID=2493646 RepID=A0AAE0TDR3_9BIVA|nr:hypothetical protein CHS0354_004743 [Potamilus streckersoni]
MLEFYFIIGSTLFLEAIPVKTAEIFQYDYDSFYEKSNSRYWVYGCCGSKYGRYNDGCCVQNPAGIIAGAVTGSLVGSALLIGLIVACCVAAKNTKSQGTVIQPPPPPNSTIQTCFVSNTTVTQGLSTNPGPYGGPSTNPGPYGPVGYGYPGGFPPPSYGQYNNVPQGGTDPAYPPPPPAKY